jgi:hypothetical protein
MRYLPAWSISGSDDGLPLNLYRDAPPLERNLHHAQMDLLIRLLKHLWSDRSDFPVSGTLIVIPRTLQDVTREVSSR